MRQTASNSSIKHQRATRAASIKNLKQPITVQIELQRSPNQIYDRHGTQKATLQKTCSPSKLAQIWGEVFYTRNKHTRSTEPKTTQESEANKPYYVLCSLVLGKVNSVMRDVPEVGVSGQCPPSSRAIGYDAPRYIQVGYSRSCSIDDAKRRAGLTVPEAKLPVGSCDRHVQSRAHMPWSIDILGPHQRTKRYQRLAVQARHRCCHTSSCARVKIAILATVPFSLHTVAAFERRTC